MTQRLKQYPYSCPVCRSTADIDLIDSEYEEDEYVESWQCDGCGAEWTATFEHLETVVKEVEPI